MSIDVQPTPEIENKDQQNETFQKIKKEIDELKDNNKRNDKINETLIIEFKDNMDEIGKSLTLDEIQNFKKDLKEIDDKLGSKKRHTNNEVFIKGQVQQLYYIFELLEARNGENNQHNNIQGETDKVSDITNAPAVEISTSNEVKSTENYIDNATTNTADTEQSNEQSSETSTSPEQTSTPSSTAETGKQKKNDPFERVTNVIDRLSDFEWEKGGGFFNNMKNLLATFGGKGFEGMLQKNPNIENDNTVLNNLSEVKKARKICGLDYIKDIIKNGGQKQIKELQYELWTPENKLSITGKIDVATATALKYYIDNKDNTGNSDASLNRPILTMGYEAQSELSTLDNVQGTLYKKTSGNTVEGYIFEGNDPKFITADIGMENDGSLKLQDSATIQYADGTKEVGEFNENLKLQNGTRFDSNHPKGQIIEGGQVKKENSDSNEGNENDSTEATSLASEISEGGTTSTTSTTSAS